MSRIYESHIEEWVVELLEKQGFAYLSPEEQEVERGDLHDAVLAHRLRDAVARLNPEVSEDAREDAIKKVLALASSPVHGVRQTEYLRSDNSIPDRLLSSLFNVIRVNSCQNS